MRRDHSAEIRRLEAAYKRVDVLARERKEKLAAKIARLKKQST